MNYAIKASILLTFIFLLGCKVCGMHGSWWIVFSPLLAYYAIMMTLPILLFLFAAHCWLVINFFNIDYPNVLHVKLKWMGDR